LESTILYIPEIIDSNEILVRFIFTSDFKKNKIEISRISDEIFIDTRGGVSLQRHSFCNEINCKKLALNIPNKIYVGFVIFKKIDFLKVKEAHKKERQEFDAEILFTPQDEENNIIQDKSNIYTNTPKNPSHSDLYYLNPAVINDESVKTAVRHFSRKLIRSANIIIDDTSDDLKYSQTAFTNFY
jgi:hypothetical protein